MPEERLYIKIVLPRQGAAKRKTGGGGKITPFKRVTPVVRQKLVSQLESVESLFGQAPLTRPVVPLKALITQKALAKTHWQGALFNEQTCPVIGAGKPGEIYVKGTRRGIANLKSRIRDGRSPQVMKEISAVKELRSFTSSDRLNGVGSADLFSHAEFSSGRRVVKVKLFDLGNPDDQSAVASAFEQQLQLRAISAIRHPQYKHQDIYSVSCRSAREVQVVADLLMVRSVGLMPRFRPLKQQQLNSRPIPDLLQQPEPDPNVYPIVGLVDSGVATSVPQLESWIYARERFVARAEENTYHGTFVAGLLIWAHQLNLSHPEIGPHPCRVLDVHVLPNMDPTHGPVGSITEAELLQDLDACLRKHSNEVKVWNLSLGSDEICMLDRFSDFAVQLDNLQEQYAVTFVIAAGNYQNAPLLPYPRPLHSSSTGRITSPADSVLGITVASISQVDHPTTGTRRGEPSPFSRHGPGPNYVIKPDLVHFGGNVANDLSQALGITSIDNGPRVADDIGTSFATPLVARQLAHIHHSIVPAPSPMLARAILTHNARDIRSSGRVKDGEDHFLGFGTPLAIDRALECTPWMTTLVFEEELRPGFFLEWDNFPFPESLSSGNKFRGEIWMTLAYPPARNQKWGSEYCETHVSAHFGVYRDTPKGEKFTGLVPPEHSNPSELYESFQVQHLRKWAPVRTYYAIFPNGISGKRWRLYVELLCRHEVEHTTASNQRFALVVTIADPGRRAPVYNEMARSLRTRFQTQNLSLRSAVRVQPST